MIVGNYFKGDYFDILKWVQHDCYNQSVMKIFHMAKKRFVRAQRIVGIETDLYNLIKEKTSFDHRLLQPFHDVIAAFYRYKRPSLSKISISDYKKYDYKQILAKEWNGFLQKELNRIFNEEKTLIRAIVKAVAFQNTQKGYNAEDYIWNSLNYIYPEKFISQIEEKRIKQIEETKNHNKQKGEKVMELKVSKSEIINFLKAFELSVSKFGISTSLYLHAKKEENLIKIIINDPAEIGIKIEYNLSGEVKDSGFISINYYNFISVIFEIEMDSEYINLKFENNKFEINIDNAIYKFSATSVNNYKFISFSNNNMASIKQKDLKKAFKYTMFNSMENDIKTGSFPNYLAGVKFELLDEEMNLIATNNYRLSFYNLKNVKGNFLQEGILNSKTVYFLKGILNDENNIYFKKIGDEVCFKTNKMKMISNLYKDEFPNYSVVLLDNKTKSVIKFKTKEFDNILKRMSAPFSVYKESISLTIEVKENIINMNMKSPDENSANTKIKASENINDCKISFETKDVIEFLDTIDDDYVKLHINKEDDPVIFTLPSLPNYQYIIMPIHLTEDSSKL